MAGKSRRKKAEDKGNLMRFVVLAHRVLARGEGAIRRKPFAVRYARFPAGFSDPLEGKAGLWAALAGLKRWAGKVERKLLRAPRMSRFIYWHLRSQFEEGRQDSAALWAATALAFFFLLRASEYLGGTQRAVRGADLEPHRGGSPGRIFPAC